MYARALSGRGALCAACVLAALLSSEASLARLLAPPTDLDDSLALVADIVALDSHTSVFPRTSALTGSSSSDSRRSGDSSSSGSSGSGSSGDGGSSPARDLQNLPTQQQPFYELSNHEGDGFRSHLYRPRATHSARRRLPEVDPSSELPRVAVNFFGLTRSLSHTAASIEQYLLQPIRDAGYIADVFLHTYDLTVLTSTLYNESGTHLNPGEWRLLNPLAAEVTNQAQFLAQYSTELDRCRHAGRPKGHTGWEADRDPEGANWTNMACQLHSQSRVSRLWQAEHPLRNYTAVIYARPDVLYNCRFPVQHLEYIQDNTVYVPDWEHAGGLNDRFAMAVPRVAEQLGNRLFFTFGTCGSLPVHSEQYTKRFVKTNGLEVIKMTKFRFYRVRANGEIADRDTQLLVPCDRPALKAFQARHKAAASG